MILPEMVEVTYRLLRARALHCLGNWLDAAWPEASPWILAHRLTPLQ